MGRKRRSRNQDTGRTIDQEGERPRRRTTHRRRRSTSETQTNVDEPTEQRQQQVEQTRQESYGEPISPMSQPEQQQQAESTQQASISPTTEPQTEQTQQETKTTPTTSTVEFTQQQQAEPSQMGIHSMLGTINQYSEEMYIYHYVPTVMVGKKRGYNPNSPNKVALNVYNIASARAGIYATESPILQMMIYEYAKNAAQKWDAYGSWSAALYNRIVAQHKLSPYQKAAVRALIGQASKYLEDVSKGVEITKQQLYEELKHTADRLGVTVPDEVLNGIVVAVLGST